MKTRTLIQAALVAALAAVPALSFAQQDQAPKTRAEVRAELIQLEKAGYNPGISNDADYPANIQEAEARVQQQGAVAQVQGVADTGYGPAMAGTTQAGATRVAPATDMTSHNSIYFGH